MLPMALTSFLMCAWRWAYELTWVGRFPVASGRLLSHWQIWFFCGVLWQTGAVKLWHYGSAQQPPEELTLDRDASPVRVP
jgi:hypothetical protein